MFKNTIDYNRFESERSLKTNKMYLLDPSRENLPQVGVVSILNSLSLLILLSTYQHCKQLRQNLGLWQQILLFLSKCLFVQFQVPSVKFQLPSAQFKMHSVKLQMPSAQIQMHSAKFQMHSALCLVSDAQCLVLSFRCIVPNFKCIVPNFKCIVLSSSAKF